MAKLFEEEYKRLNHAQKEAVDTIEGPVMVVAGPGTGKTQVIALRIGTILKKTDTQADGILSLTFTNAGVEAMRKRLHSYIGPEAGRVKIATFHSFATEIIEEFFSVLGFHTAPKTLDDVSTLSLVDEILNNNEWEQLRPRGNSALYFKDLKSLISLLKRERMNPEEFKIEIEKEVQHVQDNPDNISSRGPSKGALKKEALTKIESLKRALEVVKFYELYEKAKLEKEVMDYDDILSYLVRLASESDNVRDTIRERFLYVLVDEHQDSSGVQNQFLKAVWQDVERPNIFVVGDDRQLIYGFGGASLLHFEEFKKTFKGVKVITLTDNYRSTQMILDAAETLLKSSLTNEKLVSQSKEAHPITLVECDYPRDEIIQAGLFFEKKLEEGLAPQECALLVPKNAQVRSAVTQLRDMGLPVYSVQTLRLFDASEFRSMMTILKILDNPFSNIAIGESLLDPVSNIPPLSAHEFLHEVYTRKLSLKDLLSQGEKFGLLGQADPIYQWGKRLQDSMDKLQNKSIYEIVQTIGYDYLLDEQADHDTYIKHVEIVRSFLHLALSLEEKDPKVNLRSLIEYIERLELYGENIPLSIFSGEEGIRVATLHGSKGLEFDAVWIAHMNERALMSSKKMNFTLPESIKSRLEEKSQAVAKRELYVAITRAKRFCALSYSKFSYTGSFEQLASVVEELPREIFVEEKMPVQDILKTNPDIFVASQAVDAPQMNKKELQTLVGANYHKVKVSVTLLNNFYECPWKWYFRNFLQLPESLSESLQFGSVVHSTIEEILKSKKIPKEKELGEIIEKFIVQNHIIDPSVASRIQRQALGVVASFVKNAMPELYDRYESERPLSYKDPEIPTLSITGKIDLIEYDEGGQVRVTDFKTGKTRTKNEIEKIDDEERLSSYLRQLAMYSYLLERTGKGRVEVGKSRLYFVEDKHTASALYETYITSEHIDLLIRDMKEYDALIQSGEWTERPCHFKPWGSGETECPYCKMGKMYLSR